MRYAIVTETYPPDVNGVALTVHGLEQGLRDRGHAVDVVRPRREAAQVAAAHELLVRGAALPRYPGLQFGLPATRRLVDAWTHRRPDALYIATEGPLGWSALRAARRLGIPVSTGFHTRFDQYVRDYGAPFLERTALAWMRRFHNGGGATLVPTRELLALLQANGFAHAVRLPRAVDTAAFHPMHRTAALRRDWGLDDDALAVIHVGRLAAEKNLALAVDAFRAIQRTRPDARMVFVGDGPVRASLQREHPDFVFCGIQRGPALARHFASGDLFLFPSLTDTFGNVVLEAAASGVPTVAFDTGAAREVIAGDRGGRVVPPGDTAAFVAASIALATVSPSARADLRLDARAQVDALRPARVAADFDLLLQRLAQEATMAGSRLERFGTRDAGWCLRANRYGTYRAIRGYFSAVSRLGDGVFWYALMVALAVVDGLDGAGAALHMLATGTVALVLYKSLKRWTRRPRPFAADVRIRAWVAPLDEFSFPSGHTLHAVSFTLVAVAYYPLLAWILVPFAASVAVSRVVLGLHYPSDVLAATVIGCTLSLASLAAGTMFVG